MKEIYISKNGISARIHEWRSEENPIIICLHGLGGTSLSFIELGELLKGKYRIISVDLPNLRSAKTQIQCMGDAKLCLF